MMKRVKIFKICGNLLYSLLFLSYGSVKILTGHFPRHISLQIRLVVSLNFFTIGISLYATKMA